jgi:hypothetical protein
MASSALMSALPSGKNMIAYPMRRNLACSSSKLNPFIRHDINCLLIDSVGCLCAYDFGRNHLLKKTAFGSKDGRMLYMQAGRSSSG